MNRREFLAASVAGAAALNQGLKVFAAAPPDIQVTVDAANAGAPISPLIFGGYMEPATTRAWAEMLTDRKFARPVTNAAPPPVSPFMRRLQGEPFKPAGPEAMVTMDKADPFVGKQSPRVQLDSTEPRGIQQSKLRFGRGKAYVGRVYLAGDPGANVVVRVIWGPEASDSKTISMPTLDRMYQRVPFEFTAPADTEEGRLEIVGTGSGTFHIGTVSLMPADNIQGFHAGMIRLFKEAGFAMAKWPGGNFVSAYDWRDGVGDRDKRPPRFEPMWSNAIESNDVGLHEFIGFCRLLGAEPDIAVNTGFGEARVAADEVEYCNGSTSTPMGKLRAENGEPEPFNIHLWTIGNEMYGPWQFGHMAADQYCVKHNYFVEAMKEADPTIKVTSAGATICEASWCAAEQKQFEHNMWQPPVLSPLPFAVKSTNDFDGWMLTNCADNIDFLSEHTYAYPDLAFDSDKQAFVDVQDPLQLRTRRMANRISAAFEMWDKYLELMPSLKEKNIKFIFDEWGTRYRSAQGGRGGFQRPPGMVTPLSYALFLHELFRHSDMVGASCPTGGLGTVLTDITGDAVGFAASGLVMKIMATHFAGALPVAVNGNSPQQRNTGTPLVDMGTKPTGSATYPLDVAAALTAARTKFLLSVVNPTEEGQHFEARITGVKLRAAGKLSQIVAPSLTAENEPGKDPVIRIVETPQAALPETIEVPPISVSVYEFEIENA